MKQRKDFSQVQRVLDRADNVPSRQRSVEAQTDELGEMLRQAAKENERYKEESLRRHEYWRKRNPDFYRGPIPMLADRIGSLTTC